MTQAMETIRTFTVKPVFKNSNFMMHALNLGNLFLFLNVNFTNQCHFFKCSRFYETVLQVLPRCFFPQSVTVYNSTFIQYYCFNCITSLGMFQCRTDHCTTRGRACLVLLSFPRALLLACEHSHLYEFGENFGCGAASGREKP